MKTVTYNLPQQPVIDIVKIDKNIIKVLENVRNKHGNKRFSLSAATQVMSEPWVDDHQLVICNSVHAKGYGKLCSAQSILWYIALPITKASATKFHEQLLKLIDFAAFDAINIIRDKKNARQKLILCSTCKCVTINKDGDMSVQTGTSGAT